MKLISILTKKSWNILLFIFPSQLFSEASKYNMPPGVTEVSQSIFDLHMLIMLVCAVIGVVVFGIMFWSLWKYRKSSGAVASKVKDHFGLEISWTILATVILVVMAYPSTIVMIKAYDDREGDINIMVTGYQWKWQYKYLEDGISFFSNLATSQEQIDNQLAKGEYYLREVDEPLVIPINTRIRFLITGNDVIHSWWVPDFAVKQDAVPGFINTAWTNVPKPGIYRGACTELCGLKHAFMPVVVRAVEQEEYNAWVAEKIAFAEQERLLNDKVWTTEELIQRGEGVYAKNCVACHQTDGLGLPPVFPALNGSDIVMNNKVRNIEILMEGVQGAAMQSFASQLSEVDIASVITYTRRSWGNNKNGDGEIVEPKEISEKLQNTIVLEGNVSDKTLLHEESVEDADVFVAVTNDDEANVMSCMLAKEMGAHKVIALINNQAYVDLMQGKGIDVAIAPSQITIGTFLSELAGEDVVRVHSLRRGAAEAIETIVKSSSNGKLDVVGKEIGSIKLPKGATIGAILRRNKAKIAHDNVKLRENDHVILFLTDKKILPKIQEIFSPI